MKIVLNSQEYIAVTTFKISF